MPARKGCPEVCVCDRGREAEWAAAVWSNAGRSAEDDVPRSTQGVAVESIRLNLPDGDPRAKASGILS